MFKAFRLVIVAALTVLVSISASAQPAVDLDSNMTLQITRAPRGSENSGEGQTKNKRRTGPELNGEFNYELITEDGRQRMQVARYKLTSNNNAETMLGLVVDEDGIEEKLGMDYIRSFPVKQMGKCEGVKLANPGIVKYLVACTSGKYVHIVFGTSMADVLAAMNDMQNGFEPYPNGYILYIR